MVSRILQSPLIKGKKSHHGPFAAGQVIAQGARYTMNATDGDIESDTDIIEILILPAGCALVSYRAMTEGTLTGETADVGIITGTPGSTATDRTIGATFFDDLDLTIKNSPGDTAANNAPYLLDPVDYDRSIGFGGFGSDITMVVSKKLSLLIEFMATEAL